MQKNLSYKRIAGLAATALLVSFILSITLYKNLFVIKQGITDTLYITALNDKDEVSYGTEIRISKVSINGMTINPRNISLNSGWQLYDEYLIAAYNLTEPAVLEIPLNNCSDLELQFVKQVGSGYVEIHVGEYTEKLNLYSSGDWDTYDWAHEFRTESNWNIMNNPGVLSVVWILWFQIFSIFAAVKNPRQGGELNKRYFYFTGIVLWILSFFTDKLVFNSSGIQSLMKVNTLLVKILYLVLILIVARKIYTMVIESDERKRDHNKRMIRYTLIYIGIMSILLVLTWPGVWRWDEFAILENMVNWDMNIWQNYLTSVYYMLGFMLIPCAGGFIFVQIVLISVIVGKIISYLEENIGGGKKVYLMYIPFLLLPVIDSNLYPIRMSVYAFVEILYIMQIMKFSKSSGYIHTKEILIFCVLTGILGVWRTEGVVLVAVTILVAFVFLKRKFTTKGKVALTVITIAIFGLLSAPQSYMSKTWAGDAYKVSAYVEFLDDLIKLETVENPQGKELKSINKVLDTQKFVDFETGEQAFWNGGVRTGFSDQDYQEFQKATISLVSKHFPEYLSERIQLFLSTSGLNKNKTNMVRNVLKYNDGVFYGYSEEEIRQYDFFVNQMILNKPISKVVRKEMISLFECRMTEDYYKTTVFYGISYNLLIPLFVVFVLWIYSIIKRNILFVPTSVLLGQSAIVFLLAPAPYFMYYYPIFVFGYIVLFYWIITSLDKRKISLRKRRYNE